MIWLLFYLFLPVTWAPASAHRVVTDDAKRDNPKFTTRTLRAGRRLVG